MSDLISRKDAINEIKSVFDDILCCKVSVRKGLPEAVKRIEIMPSADRPQGKWKEITVRVDGHRTIYYQHDRCYEIYKSQYNFCPHCGTKMEVNRE